jgi:hypothetical protein
MSSRGSRPNPYSRIAANVVMFGALVASGISLSLLLAGQRELALQVCGISGVILLVLLFIGAYFVAKSRSA